MRILYMKEGKRRMEIEKLSGDLIRKGCKHGWQDVYILPEDTCYGIYYRVGKKRSLYQKLNSRDAQQLISRFKYLGQMDVGEKRKSQLGAITCSYKGGRQRLRLSTVGDYLQRESLVMRFLFRFGAQAENYALPFQLKQIRRQMDRRGLYLFSGPVGSGKTTLMYKLAKEIDGQVVTIEDPVEIEEPQFLQLQTNSKISQDYDTLIRLSLRHHPDILIIGEIRDEKTAQAAIRAALTGHYVLATIHARGLESVKGRLMELGRNTTEIEECLQGVIYQEMIQHQSEAQVLCAFQFFKDGSLTEESTWRQAQALVRKTKS